MEKRIKYADAEERQRLLTENETSSMRLVEDQIFSDGNYLVFSDAPEPPAVLTLSERLKALEERVASVEAKIP